jgi:hypothetical protein
MQVLPRSAGGSDQINRAIIVETPLKPARARHFCEETMLSELPELNSRKIRDEVLSELHELDPAKLRAEVLREIREQLFLTYVKVAFGLFLFVLVGVLVALYVAPYLIVAR